MHAHGRVIPEIVFLSEQDPQEEREQSATILRTSAEMSYDETIELTDVKSND